MNNNAKIDVLINNNAIILITPPQLRRGNVYFSITPPHMNYLQIHPIQIHPIQIKSNNNISNTYLYPIQIQAIIQIIQTPSIQIQPIQIQINPIQLSLCKV